jgi:hypothetical protein
MILNKWLNKQTKKADWSDNTYTPRAKNIVCVRTTVYPNDKPVFSPNGTGEFYGLVELKNEKK